MARSSELQPDVFETAWLRRILGGTRRDRLSSDDIKKHLHLQKDMAKALEILQLCYENE